MFICLFEKSNFGVGIGEVKDLLLLALEGISMVAELVCL